MNSTQANMMSSSPKAESEDHLTALPAELLVNIVEQLPVREICRLRSLSRHVRDFIDTNQGRLTQGLISYHRTRINFEYTYLTDLSDCDIIDALRRYDSHHGLDPETDAAFPHHSFKQSAMTLTMNHNWLRSHRLPSTVQHERAGHWLQMSYFMISADDSECRKFLKSLWDTTPHPRSFGFTEGDSFVAKFMELLSTRDGVAHGTVPPYFLTERKVAPIYSCPAAKTREGHCDYGKTSKLLLLLRLPDLQQDEGTLAYCSMSGNAVHLVDEVDQGPSTVLKQAAIIEEIFIW
jgi:hypothetical protein